LILYLIFSILSLFLAFYRASPALIRL
jgi:hypothetical protein